MRWVLVEKPLPASYAVPAGRVALDTPGLQLVDLGAPTGSAGTRDTSGWRRWLVLGGDLVALVVLAGVSVVHIRRGRYAPART